MTREDSTSVPGAGLPEDLLEIPLPDFEVLAQQASLEGLQPRHLVRFRDSAVSQPTSVLRDVVDLSCARRNLVPTTLVCCSLPAEEVLKLAAAGHPMFVELTDVDSLDAIDLPTGHWPMWSRPYELAQIINEADYDTAD